MIEQRIHEIWARSLDLPTFSDDDDFFSLGGHSLIMARIQQQITEAFGIELPMDELFRHATVNQISARVRALVPAA